ncbi:MAG: hypothetical protein J6386_09175 [Candidatus Synoicihabitans palmerolidicus]|nr:hypothetical protein [Candidatus Synoicihabitans palmerolidicus]
MIDQHLFAGEGELMVQASIPSPAGAIGRVMLSRPLRSVNALIWSERTKLASGALLVSVVMVGLGWWLANKLTGSLQRLTSYAVGVRDGRGAKPPASRTTEIAELGAAFEGIRRRLEGKDYVEHYTHNLAHELKAPLSAIRGAVELMQEDSMPAEDRARFLGHLRSESQRVQGIIDRMLKLAALESRTGSLEQEDVDLTSYRCGDGCGARS